MKFIKFEEKNTQNACCALCGLDMGFPCNGETHYCFNEYTCGQEIDMKKMLLILALLVSVLNAGKVIWGADGKPIITGTVGAGCSENVFDTNETKENRCDQGKLLCYIKIATQNTMARN